MPTADQPAVLYVDDEPINLRVFDANFQTLPRHLLRRGPEALEMLPSGAGEVGVLLSDQRMPGDDGRGAAGEGARSWRRTPSGCSSPRTRTCRR